MGSVRPVKPPPVSDHQAITETVYRYGFALDTQDWVLYRSVFADEVEMDLSTYHGRPLVRMPADELVASAALLFAGFAATQHTMSNPMVTIDPSGQSAKCTMHIQAAHATESSPDAGWFVMGGHYHDTLVRHADGGWVLTGVNLVMRWSQGDREIMRTALTRGRARRTT